MILATLRTRIVEKTHPVLPTEGGFFEVEVSVDEGVMQRSGDLRGYGNKTIAAHLAQAIKSTTVPADLWTIEFSDRAIRRYGFPPFLSLKP